jgi:dynein light chain 1
MPWATEHAAARTSRLGACSVAFSATVAGAKSLNARLRLQEVKQNCVATEAEKVLLFGQLPPIVKMDNTLGTLKACKHLALSSNCIEKITGLKGLDMLEVLSIGRNCIKKLEGLDEVAGTLQQLWCSYNLIDKLNGIEKLTNLTVLYMRWCHTCSLSGMFRLLLLHLHRNC